MTKQIKFPFRVTAIYGVLIDGISVIRAQTANGNRYDVKTWATIQYSNIVDQEQGITELPILGDDIRVWHHRTTNSL
jgi:hypothetical protein